MNPCGACSCWRSIAMGRQGDALKAFHRARAVIVEELGVDPSPELERLQHRILEHDPGLELRGEPLRGYRLLEKLDEGRSGVLYRAIQPKVGRDVAVRVFHEQVAADPTFVRRIRAAGAGVAALEHPHIAPVYDYWREPGRAYLVTRFLKGGSLRALLERWLDARRRARGPRRRRDRRRAGLRPSAGRRPRRRWPLGDPLRRGGACLPGRLRAGR